MPTGKFNVGRGLLRLYLVVWMLIAIASLVGGHREVMTYLGSTYWSAENIDQRQKRDCKTEECWKPPASDGAETVEPAKAKESVELFAILVLAVPAVLLLVMVVIFKLLAWAFAGFKTN